MISYTLADCDLGTVLIASRGKGICILQLGDNPGELEKIFLKEHPEAEKKKLAIPDEVLQKIIVHLDNPNKEINVELDIQGTDFQKRVWEELQKIPVGKSETYSKLAQKLGAADAVRAVATACGANPIAVLIPCHRVIRSDGGLGGYRWGIWRKQTLLKLEGNLLV
jgi:AraC family transcriptional regulator of adaptative response/methylated-DNA-[protein]-cysteine methyltransferase